MPGKVFEARPFRQAIAGSRREGSFNRSLIRAAQQESLGDVCVRVYDRLRDVAPYDQDQDVDPAPPAVARLRRAIGSADAVLFATPEYNHSIPGVLKNAVDWASRPYGDSVLIDKPGGGGWVPVRRCSAPLPGSASGRPDRYGSCRRS